MWPTAKQDWSWSVEKNTNDSEGLFMKSKVWNAPPGSKIEWRWIFAAMRQSLPHNIPPISNVARELVVTETLNSRKPRFAKLLWTSGGGCGMSRRRGWCRLRFRHYILGLGFYCPTAKVNKCDVLTALD
jgi:hypothetical protein